MASWFDIIGLIIVAGIFGGTVYGVIFLVDKVSKTVNDTKEQLKSKGYTISDKGLSVKTSGRMTHEDYIDATQRGIINTMNKTKSASTFRTISEDGSPRTPPTVSRQNSGASVHSFSSVSGSLDEGGKKKGLLGRRK